jgi:hypothetical protein
MILDFATIYEKWSEKFLENDKISVLGQFLHNKLSFLLENKTIKHLKADL